MEEQVKTKKSNRFSNYDEYLKSATKTAKQVAYNRKENVIFRWYGITKKFEEYVLPAFHIYMDLEARRNFYINECDCPITILWEYLNAVNFEKEDLSTFGVISKVITKTTQESFERWGDKNHLKDIRRAYISPEGTALDIQAQGIEFDYGIAVTENDFVEFILAYPKGAKYYESFTYIGDLSDKFKQMVGIPIDEEFTRKFLANLGKKDSVPQEGDFAPIEDEPPF